MSMILSVTAASPSHFHEISLDSQNLTDLNTYKFGYQSSGFRRQPFNESALTLESFFYERFPEVGKHENAEVVLQRFGVFSVYLMITRAFAILPELNGSQTNFPMFHLFLL